jgi:hypothetical protein
MSFQQRSRERSIEAKFRPDSASFAGERAGQADPDRELVRKMLTIKALIFCLSPAPL